MKFPYYESFIPFIPTYASKQYHFVFLGTNGSPHFIPNAPASSQTLPAAPRIHTAAGFAVESDSTTAACPHHDRGRRPVQIRKG
jgi:hypothetical protein